MQARGNNIFINGGNSPLQYIYFRRCLFLFLVIKFNEKHAICIINMNEKNLFK